MDKEQQQDNNNDASAENQGGVKQTVKRRRTLRSSTVRTNTAPNNPDDDAVAQASPQPDSAAQAAVPGGNEETPSTTKRKLRRTPTLEKPETQPLEAGKDSSAAAREEDSASDPTAAATHQLNDEKSPYSPPQHQQQVEGGSVKGRRSNESPQISLSSLSEISPLSVGKNGDRFFASDHLEGLRKQNSGRGQNEDDDPEMVRQGGELDFEQVFKSNSTSSILNDVLFRSCLSGNKNFNFINIWQCPSVRLSQRFEELNVSRKHRWVTST